MIRGSLATRMCSSLQRIGPSVLNGGVSTLIAIVMLMTSESHVFIAYYKVLHFTFNILKLSSCAFKGAPCSEIERAHLEKVKYR